MVRRVNLFLSRAKKRVDAPSLAFGAGLDVHYLCYVPIAAEAADLLEQVGRMGRSPSLFTSPYSAHLRTLHNLA